MRESIDGVVEADGSATHVVRVVVAVIVRTKIGSDVVWVATGVFFYVIGAGYESFEGSGFAWIMFACMSVAVRLCGDTFLI